MSRSMRPLRYGDVVKLVAVPIAHAQPPQEVTLFSEGYVKAPFHSNV